jgi:hypothetical protein
MQKKRKSISTNLKWFLQMFSFDLFMKMTKLKCQRKWKMSNKSSIFFDIFHTRKNNFLVVLWLSNSQPVMLLNFLLLVVFLLIFCVNLSISFGSLLFSPMNDQNVSNVWNIFIQENILQNPRIKNCFVNYCSKGSANNIQILRVLEGGNFR